MNIYVCVGSSCHIKGSYDIINMLRERLEQNGLTEEVKLSAAFCLGKCTDGVSIKIDNEIVCGVSKENFDEVFESKVMSNLTQISS